MAEDGGRTVSEAKGRWMKATSKLTAEKVVVEAIMEERHKKKKAKKMKKICLKTLKFAMSTTGLMIVNIGVMLLGGFIFSRLEEVNEKQSCVNSRLDYQKAENTTIILLMDMATQLAGQTALSDQQKASTQADFQKYLQDFAGGVLTTGYDPALVCETLGEPDGASMDWSFEGAVLFALTVVTTIGYGHIAPATFWGRVVCIAYAIIGIPIFMLALANFGEILANLFRATYSTVCCCGCCRKKEEKDLTEDMTEKDEEYVQKAAAVWKIDPASGRPIPPSEDVVIEDDEEDEEEEEDAEGEDEEKLTVPLTITITIWMGFIFIGAIVFSQPQAEGWTFDEAFYYCTITATTIGFGDYVPTVQLGSLANIMYFIWVIFYITLSMAAISMCFTLILDEIVTKVEWIGEKLGLRKKEDGEEDDADKDEKKEMSDLEKGESNV